MATTHLRVVPNVPEQIACPPWCEVAVEEHRAELTGPLSDGECDHVRRFPLPGRAELRMGCSTFPDGSTYDGRPSAPELMLPELDLTLEDAEEVARVLLVAVRACAGEPVAVGAVEVLAAVEAYVNAEVGIERAMGRGDALGGLVQRRDEARAAVVALVDDVSRRVEHGSVAAPRG